MILYAALTKEGDRKPNEDYVSIYQEGNDYLFVLADGLGGHGKGEVASQYAVTAAINAYKRDLVPEENLRNMFENAQTVLLSMQKEDFAVGDLKTTLTMLIIQNNIMQYGHIGDSRCYVFSKLKNVERTLDHSVPQVLALTGEIKENKIRNHPDQNRLLKVIGSEWSNSKYELGKAAECGNKRFLLCSDGFWNLILEKQMLSCLKKSKNPQEWLEKMERIVLKSGKNKNMDNYSAIAVWCD